MPNVVEVLPPVFSMPNVVEVADPELPATVSYAVAPGASSAYRDTFAHGIATRPCYDIYMGGCHSHLLWPETYNNKRTFAGRSDVTVRTIKDIPPPGSLLVMRARDTKQFYVARVTGLPEEKIVPCGPDGWEWSYRRPKHQEASRHWWLETVAAGLPAEDYMLSIPVDGWRLVSEPTAEQTASYGEVRRSTIQKMKTTWPE